MTKTKSALALADTAPDHEIDTDKSRLDLAFVHDFLVRSHWAKGIPFAVMAKAIENSITFGLYRDGRQVGFARVVTDHATFAYLADVFIAEEERNCGLGRSLVDTILAHPELQGMRRWLLGTRDAQSLYRRCGFAEPPASFRFLERLMPGGYAGAATGGRSAAAWPPATGRWVRLTLRHASRRDSVPASGKLGVR